uniref:Uncharacterized protein n=1 Tax=Arundo donax TaxID=35708 RepID=A0A0A9FPC7_ARUDO
MEVISPEYMVKKCVIPSYIIAHGSYQIMINKT